MPCVIRQKEDNIDMKELSKIALAVEPSSTMAIDTLFKQMKAEGQDVIGFGAGEPDFNTPDYIKEAGIAAIEHNETRYTPSSGTVELRKAFERRRDYMVERMNSIEGVSCIKPHGAFYVMMNIEKLIGQELHGVVIRDADDFGNLFLKYGKVAVVPGTGFGAPTFVRWSYATSIENIKEGLNRLERFLKGETI